MLKDPAQPDWTHRIIAAFVMMVALAEGTSWLTSAAANTETVIVTSSCAGFKPDALKLLDTGSTAALNGTFERGDHVHLAIDFKGVGYSWQLTGALGSAQTDVTGTGRFTTITTTGSTSGKWTYNMELSTSRKTMSSAPTPGPSPEVRGTITGSARLSVDVDVTAAGEGAITINKAGSLPLFGAPKLVIASCSAATNGAARPAT